MKIKIIKPVRFLNDEGLRQLGGIDDIIEVSVPIGENLIALKLAVEIKEVKEVKEEKDIEKPPVDKAIFNPKKRK